MKTPWQSQSASLRLALLAFGAILGRVPSQAALAPVWTPAAADGKPLPTFSAQFRIIR